MFSKLLGGTDVWRPVAIDTGSYGWRSVAEGLEGKPREQGNHIVIYEINDRTGERRVRLDDADERARKYGEEKNSEVAEARTLWAAAGQIDPPNKPKYMRWLDSSYAPHGDFEDLIRAVETNDDLVESLESNPQVKQAWKHLVASVKLTKNL